MKALSGWLCESDGDENDQINLTQIGVFAMHYTRLLKFGYALLVAGMLWGLPHSAEGVVADDCYSCDHLVCQYCVEGEGCDEVKAVCVNNGGTPVGGCVCIFNDCGVICVGP